MTPVRSLMSLAVFVALLWTISATQVSLEESADEARGTKTKVKKAFKEAAMLLEVVKNLGQLVTMIVGPLLQLKGVSISAFTALVTFFWFAYELLKTKEPTKFTILLPPSAKQPQEEPTPSHPTVAILPVITSHESHTFDYDDYSDVYNYKQHFGNKRINLNRPNFHVRR